MPKSLNALMKLLRESGIQINGSHNKAKLKRIGYYHGYKGYRFCRESNNRLPVDNFDQIMLLADFDMALKSLFYPRIMEVETALKNFVLDAVLMDAQSSDFNVIWNKSIKHYHGPHSNDSREVLTKRLKLRKDIDALIFQSRRRKVIEHFHDTNREVPLWALFETMMLGLFGSFYECLDARVQQVIVDEMRMPPNQDSKAVLGKMIFALKQLRNTVAHNGIILDARFQDAAIRDSLKELLETQMNIQNVQFREITDYVVLLVYLMSSLGFTRTERKRFIGDYVAIIERYRSELPFQIFSQIMGTDVRNKIESLRIYVATN